MFRMNTHFFSFRLFFLFYKQVTVFLCIFIFKYKTIEPPLQSIAINLGQQKMMRRSLSVQRGEKRNTKDNTSLYLLIHSYIYSAFFDLAPYADIC